jgi:hypothetical protein
VEPTVKAKNYLATPEGLNNEINIPVSYSAPSGLGQLGYNLPWVSPTVIKIKPLRGSIQIENLAHQ